MTTLFHILFYYLPFSDTLYNLVNGEHEYVEVVQALKCLIFPLIHLKKRIFFSKTKFTEFKTWNIYSEVMIV